MTSNCNGMPEIFTCTFRYTLYNLVAPITAVGSAIHLKSPNFVVVTHCESKSETVIVPCLYFGCPSLCFLSPAPDHKPMKFWLNTPDHKLLEILAK